MVLSLRPAQEVKWIPRRWFTCTWLRRCVCVSPSLLAVEGVGVLLKGHDWLDGCTVWKMWILIWDKFYIKEQGFSFYILHFQHYTFNLFLDIYSSDSTYSISFLYQEGSSLNILPLGFKNWHLICFFFSFFFLFSSQENITKLKLSVIWALNAGAVDHG